MSPELPWIVGHLLLSAACFAIAATFYHLVKGRPGDRHPYARTAIPLIAIFVLIGLFHLITLPVAAGSSSWLVWLSGAAAVGAAGVTALLVSDVLAGRDLRSFNDLRRQMKHSSEELEALEVERQDLAGRVAAATLKLSEATQRFETTLRKSPVFVSNQDGQLNYTWARNPPPGLVVEDMLGRDDWALFPEKVASALTGIKTNTLLTKEHGRIEVEIESRDGSRWYEIGVDPMVNEDGEVTGITTAAIDVSGRKRAEAQQKLLLRDVTHRAKNVLAVVNAVARQTATRTSTKDEFVDRFTARVQALARSHDLLVNEDWQGVRLGDLVHSQLSRFEKLIGNRIDCGGPDLTLGPEATQNLGLAIHELAHNAGKYGALSNEDGRVHISWDVAGEGGDRRLSLIWEEQGGPAVAAEQRMGFGRTFIERAVGQTLDGATKLEFRPSGVYCRMEVPGYHLLRLPAAQ